MVVGAFFFVVRGCFLVVFVEALDVLPDCATYLSRRFCAAIAIAGSYYFCVLVPRGLYAGVCLKVGGFLFYCTIWARLTRDLFLTVFNYYSVA